MNKKQKNNTYAITFTAAARRLGVSISTVQRLARKGTLHTTEPQLRRHHWTRGIRVDKAFEAERARRLNGLKAPRRKTIPTDVTKYDPSPIQTVTPPAEPQPAFIVNARGYLATWHLQQPTLFLTANKAIFDFNGELDLVDRVAAHVDKTADYVSGQISSAEGIYTRCTAILAAACILQLILAAYYTICHFNII